jgi:hypothetical protein
MVTHTSENMLRQLQILQIQQTYVISSPKKLKNRNFSPTLLRNFPLKKSDFLWIFKNVLTAFYYMQKHFTIKGSWPDQLQQKSKLQGTCFEKYMYSNSPNRQVKIYINIFDIFSTHNKFTNLIQHNTATKYTIQHWSNVRMTNHLELTMLQEFTNIQQI